MASVDGEHSERDLVKEEPRGIKMERTNSSNGKVLRSISAVSIKDEGRLNGSTSPSKPTLRQSSSSPGKSESSSPPPPEKAEAEEEEPEEKIGGEITVKMAPGQPPKLARSSSQKVASRAPPLFDHFEDKTSEATSHFQVIEACIYMNKNMGYTEHGMECDCPEEWDPTTKQNTACGDDSDCINRLTKIECVGDCGCGADCENQRFQRRQYANVSVIKTEKKGYGLRANSDLRAGDFIFEYIGEVINENHFRRRTIQYDEEGIKHFYFMSLSKGEFVDATRKGNLGRFCNHSCNPNCYVDKWVVGDKLRMGIFAERKIKAGEELVFNYNVDRYGADPQPCYCGEPNCALFIGGKTQTERATKLSNATIEALGIDDGDGWDTAVAKKPRKKKVGEDDEEYVDSLQPKSLDEDGVTKVMATLMQCKEKWIAVKLLERIQRCNDERVRNRVIKMHGYQILSSQLSAWKEDNNVVLQILDILDKFPKLTRNKIVDSKIEDNVKTLVGNDDVKVHNKASALLQVWSTLEIGYRIPRLKRDPTAVVNTPEKRNRFERRESREERKRSRSRSRSQSPSTDPPRGPSAPTGPRNSLPQRSNSYFPGQRPPFRRPFAPLPAGWYSAEDKGKTYYYSSTGQTTWTRPTLPAVQPKPPPKPSPGDTGLQNIIEKLMNQTEASQNKSATPETPQTTTTKPSGKKEAKEDRWKSFSEDKQKKVYENTLAPHITYVVNKFKTKLPRDDLKRFAKECAKKLVASDYKHGRVENPTKLSPKQEKNVKKYVKDFLDKAVAKRREHDKNKVEKKTKEEGVSAGSPPPKPIKDEVEPEEEEDIQMSDVEIEKDDVKESQSTTPDDKATNGDHLKRKRDDEDELEESKLLDESAFPTKRARSESLPPPPPPPPPPPGQEVSPVQEQYPIMGQDAEAVNNDSIANDCRDAIVEDQCDPTSATRNHIPTTTTQKGDTKMNGYHLREQSSTLEESNIEDTSSMVRNDFEGLGREEDRRVQVEGQV